MPGVALPARHMERNNLLNSPEYQTASITCPQCSNPFSTPVLTIIDVGLNPDLKGLLLSGQINVAVCPNCGHAGMLNAPLVYHDPAKELLFTFAPAGLGGSDLEQQQMIGDLTNRIMMALPAEERKGYLLQPRSFLQLEGMLNAILEADGITPEMLAAQRAKAELLERLLTATSPDARQAIAQENDAQIDYEFFQLLSLNIELAQREEQEDAAQELLGLRQQLLEWSAVGLEIAERDEAIRSLGESITREDLLDKIVEAALAGEQAKLETFITVGRQGIDYGFYQQLTGQIEAAEAAGDIDRAVKLKNLREKILDLTAQIDAEFERANQQVEKQIQDLLDSDHPEDALRSNPSQISELFMGVLTEQLRAAEQSGQVEQAAKLGRIHSAVIEMLQENQPPELRLVSQLLASEYPDGTKALLEENRELVGAPLLELMELLGKDLGESDRPDMAHHLAQVRDQAAAMVQA
jgi:hypothetical protein